MANSKISALSSASTPLAGTETLPVVQSSATVKVTVANLTAGRSVSAADYVMSTGNLVPSTAAKGINFTANTSAAGMTSQLLNWYEEGDWTPQYTNTTPPTTPYTMSIKSATYTRIGRQVTVRAYIGTSNVNTAGAGGELSISGLPFTPAAGNPGYSPAAVAEVLNWTTYPCFGYTAGDGKLYLEKRLLSNGASANMTAADLVAGASANQNLLMVTATYFV
jgi:hypothetical protein